LHKTIGEHAFPIAAASLERATTGDHVIAVTADFQCALKTNCFADRTTTHTSGNSSIDTSLIRDIYCGPEVVFETCVAMKFVDDDDDDDDNNKASIPPGPPYRVTIG